MKYKDLKDTLKIIEDSGLIKEDMDIDLVVHDGNKWENITLTAVIMPPVTIMSDNGMFDEKKEGQLMIIDKTNWLYKEIIENEK